MLKLKLVLDNEEEEKLLRKGSVSIDELVMLINNNDLDREIPVYVDADVFNPGRFWSVEK